MSNEKKSNPMVPLIITAGLVGIFITAGIGLSRYIKLPSFTSVLRTTWPVMHDRYHTLSRQGKYEQALEVISEALAYARENEGERSSRACLSLIDMTQCLTNLGRYGKAAKTGEEALDLAREVFADSQRYQIVRCLKNLGVIHYYMENYETSREWFVHAREELEILDAAPDDKGEVLDWLAAVLERQKLFDEAIPLYEEMLELYGDTVRFASDMIRAQKNLAIAYAHAGDLEASEGTFTDALAATRKYYGNESEELGDVLLDMADTYAGTGRHKGAEKLYRRAIDHLKDLPNARYPNAETAIERLMNYYRDLGHTEKVLETSRELLAWYEEMNSGMWFDMVYAYQQLGWTLEEYGRIPEAVAHYQKAVDIVDSSPDALNEDKYDAYLYLAGALDKLPDMEQAAAYRAKANALDIGEGQ